MGVCFLSAVDMTPVMLIILTVWYELCSWLNVPLLLLDRDGWVLA